MPTATNPKIEAAIQEFLNVIWEHTLTQVRREITVRFGDLLPIEQRRATKAPGLPKARNRNREPKKTLSAAQMRCRHTDRKGKRCAERSRGPRFGYLCPKHQK